MSANDIQFGIRFTASGGQQIAGEATLSADAINKLRGATGGATSEAEKLNNVQRNSVAQMQQSVSATNMLSTAVKALAGSYAVLKVVDYARDAAMLSARYETLGVSMGVVGRNAGYTAAEMDAAAVGMQKTGISMVESRQQALRLVQSHIDLANASKLARIAQDAAVIGNMNSSEAFATMIHGIQTGQTDVLRTIGLNVSMEQSYSAYAATLGRSANSLTQTEKTQAVLNAVMKEGEGIAGTYEASMGTAGKQLNSMKRYAEDLQLKLGETFNESLTVGVMAFTSGLKDANGQVSELSRNGQLQQWGNDVTDALAFVADSVNGVRVIFKTTFSAIETGFASSYAGMAAMYKAAHGDLQGASEEMRAAKIAWSDYSGQAAKDEASLGMFKRALDERRAALKQSSDEKLKIEQDYMARALKAQRDYAGYSIEIQQNIQRVLANQAGGDYQGKNKPGFVSIGPDTAAIDAAKKQASDYAGIIKTLEGNIVSATGKTAGMSAAQTELLKIMASPVWDKASSRERDRIVALTNEASAQQVLARAESEALKVEEARTKAMQDYMAGVGNETASILDRAAAAELENQKIGMSASQLVALTAERYNEQIAVKAARSAQLEGVAGREAELSLINEQINGLARLRDAAVAKPVLEASAAATAAQLADQKNLWASIDKTAHDTFVSVANGNKDLWSRMKEAGKNIFFDWLYQMTAQKWLINVGMGISGAAGVSGMANADGFAGMPGASGGGGSGISGMYQVGQSIWQGMSGGFETAAGQLGSYISSFGEAGSTLGNATTALGQTIAQYGSYLGAGAAGIGIGSMIAGNKLVFGLDGATSSAIGAAIGAAVGGPIGAFIGGVAGGVFDAAFGSSAPYAYASGVNIGVSGTRASGSQYTNYKSDGGWFSSDTYSTTTSALPRAGLDAINTVFDAVRKTVDGFAQQLGDPTLLSGLDTFSAHYSGAASGLDAWLKSTTAAMLDAALGIERFRRGGETTDTLIKRLSDTVTSYQMLVQGVDNQIALMSGTTDQFTINSKAASEAVSALTSRLANTTDFTDRVNLENQLVAAVTNRYQLELQYLNDLRGVLNNAMRSVTQAQTGVAQALTRIAPDPAMTAPQLRTAISDSVAGLGLPSMDAVIAASSRVSAAQGVVAQLQPKVDTLTNAQTAYTQAVADKNTALAALKSFAAGAYAGNGRTTQENFQANQKWSTSGYWVFGTNIATNEALKATYRTAFDQAYTAYQAQLNAVSTLGMTAAQARAQLTAAELSAETALADQIKAQEDYAAAMVQFAGDSAAAADNLTGLRDEVVKYYEAQKQLSDMMNTSASALGVTIDNLRRSSLSSVGQYSDQRAQFNALMREANGMSGADLAQRADQINALARPLVDAALANSATEFEYRKTVAGVAADLSALQSRLVTTAPQDYQAEAVSLLSGIDAALSQVQEGLSTADNSIVAAINSSKDSTVAVLQDIRVLLGGQALPGHADGLSFVPYDNYQMRAHYGEAVMDAPTITGLRKYGIPVSAPSPRIVAPAPVRVVAGAGDTSALERKIAQLTIELKPLLEAIAVNTLNSSRMDDRMAKVGIKVLA